MMRRILSLVFALLILLNIKVAATEETALEEFAWVLVEVNDYENADKWAISDAHNSYIVKHNYSRGQYSASTTYEGDDPYGQGLSGTFAVKATFSGVPDIIYPDKPVSLKFTFAPTENSVVKLSFSANASADFDQWDVQPGGVTGGARYFSNEDGESSFTISTTNSKTYNETIQAALGNGMEGSRIALRLKLFMGVAMGTNYVYEWKKVGDSTGPTLNTLPTATMLPTSKPRIPIEQNYAFWYKWSEQAKSWTPEQIEEAKKRPGIVKVGDLTGEVWLLRGWEEDMDQAIFVEFDTPLYHGDLIVTKTRSGAILSFSDMSTFVLKENSAIVLDIKNERESKIALLAGKIWTNLKKMVEDGSLEIEMSQAIAGARGTTFLCEENNGASTLKVIEGSVAFSSITQGNEKLITQGQMINATSAGLGDPKKFNVQSELNSLDGTARRIMSKDFENKRTFVINSWIIRLLVLFFIVVVAFIIILIKRSKKK